MRAERSPVVADDRIAEVGSHAEFVAHGGRYATLWATHTRHARPVR